MYVRIYVCVYRYTVQYRGTYSNCGEIANTVNLKIIILEITLNDKALSFDTYHAVLCTMKIVQEYHLQVLVLQVVMPRTAYPVLKRSGHG